MMTVHKLSAGDGYTYLTRQVASCDHLRPRGQSLVDYYAARGNPPGVWLGGGAAQLGLAGKVVSEAQMRSLFGSGLHPNAEAMLAHGATRAEVRLGRPFPSYVDLAPYGDRVAEHIAHFESTNHRAPSDAERNQITAKEAQRGRRAVAGYDLVFTPVKSASVLWGLAHSEVREQVEAAHHAAVASSLEWLQTHAAFTRSGHAGIAQLDTTGLVCAAFDHRESRTGDPDLHTHVAVANKVCGTDGKWRSLDARGLFALGVAASERYNTRFEDELRRRLGVCFEERGDENVGKRSVREIVGVPIELIRHFSRRRAAIEERLVELREEYRQGHGREPDHTTQMKLAQQATLETRGGKPPARTLAEQVEDWRTEARTVIGDCGVTALAAVLDRAQTMQQLSGDEVHQVAATVVRRVAEQRSTWTLWNIHAETERVLRPFRFATAEEREAATAAVVERATGPELSIRIAEPELLEEPPTLTRTSDGQSVFIVHGSERFTTSEVLLAEDALIEAAGDGAGNPCDEVVIDAALAIHESRAGLVLDHGQQALIRAFAGSAHRLAVGIGPAGAGKTTAMQALRDVWKANGGRVVPLATSAKAAQVLGGELGERAENLHKILFEHQPGRAPEDDWYRLREGDLVLVDEAGMAGTVQLARLLEMAKAAGAMIRLLGDPAQLAAVDAGGALRLLEHEVGATYLTDLHRFSDPYEGKASLMLRDGDPEAFRFYRDRDRIRSGAEESMLGDAYRAWSADIESGKRAVLVATRNEDVAALNARARHDRVTAGVVERDGVVLRDGNHAGVGDWVVTRENARALRYGRGRWVHNGDTWQVVRRHRDGALTVRHQDNGRKTRLTASYVADSVELAYASTAHRIQGTTTDTAHALVTREMTREALYVASTRGRHGVTWYVATDSTPDVACDHESVDPMSAYEVLLRVLEQSSSEKSATLTLREVQNEATTLPTLVKRYDHARHVAAQDALTAAVRGLPAVEQGRILNDPAASYLATTLATVASKGGSPATVLRSAYELEPSGEARSLAALLATRIEDHPRTLGVPELTAAGPLPWLPPADVGHPGWLPYLEQRAAQISSRLDELGSLSAAYRELYEVAAPDLGATPDPGTRRAAAFHAANAETAASEAADRTAAPPNGLCTLRFPSSRRKHQSLSL